MRAVANALLWPVRRIGALLPDGWGGLARQLAIFIPFDIAYELSRAFAQGGEQTALQHARDVVHAEKVLGIYHEHAVQDWALDAPDFVMEVAKFTYFQCQFTITFGFVIWVYIWRNEAYMMLRNCLFATFMLAVPGYILYPTAPPRLLVAEHFIDPLQTATLNQQGTLVKLFGNPYAGDAEPALGHGDPGRRDRRAGHAPSASPRDLGALSGPRRVLDRGDGQSLLPRRRRRRRGADRGGDARDHPAPPQGLVDRAARPPARPLTGGNRPFVETGRGRGSRHTTFRSMTTLPLRLDRIKSGYTDGARQLASRSVRVLRDSRVTPNQLTALGFSLNIVAAVLIYQETYIAAAAVFLIGSIIDILDGALARSRGQATVFGAFIDSTTDRTSEGAILCAMTLVFAREGDVWPVIAVFVALVASFLVSYTRARAEALGLDGKAGLMGRAERVVLLAVILAVAPWGALPYGIALLAVLASATVAQRIFSVHRQLAERERTSKEHA